MWFSRLVIFPPILILAMISLRVLIDSAHATAGETLHTPEAITNTRVVAAMTLTLVIMLIASLVSKSRLWMGHFLLASFMALALAMRVFGFLHGGMTLAMGNQRTITIVEGLFLVLNSIGLFMHAKQSRQANERALTADFCR